MRPGEAIVDRIPAGSATYDVDAFHTQIVWEVNHMGFSMLGGMLGAESGTLVIDRDRPGEARLEIVFAMDAMSVTAEPFRAHLASADFFDVARHPTARFVSTSVAPQGADRATITGDLTIKGRTAPVTIDATFVGAGDNPMTGKLNFGFEGIARIRRSDFDLGAHVPVVSDEVAIRINAAFTSG